MFAYLIEFLLGLVTGVFLTITGTPAFGLVLIILDYLKIGDYKSTLGAILLINMFPITIGSVWEFYKANKINYSMSAMLLFSVIIGSYLGSKLVLDERFKLSTKTIKYISSTVGFILGISFLISAYYEKN